MRASDPRLSMSLFRASGALAALTMAFAAARPVVAAEAADGMAAADWARPFLAATYFRDSRFDALPPDIGHYRLGRRTERIEPTRTLFRDCEKRLDRGHPLDCVVTFLGREGYGNAASPVDGVLDWWSPPEVILPAEVRIGVHWAAEHQKRGVTSRRTCEIRADSTFCDDGIESRCVTQFGGSKQALKPASVVVLGEHYCRGLGWVGEDALAHPDGEHTFSTFTFDLVVDGVAMPKRRESTPVNAPATVPGSGRGA